MPPPYKLVQLREIGDAHAHALAIAAEAGAGTLIQVRRFDLIEFALLLEPEESLATARRAFLAGMNALGDAISAHCPPEKPLMFEWPGTLRLDGGLIGGARFGWPRDTEETATPDWLVFSAMIVADRVIPQNPEQLLASTSLAEEGMDAIDPAAIIESFSRHLMAQFDTWQEQGFEAVGRAYLERLAIGKTGDIRRIDDHGNLHVRHHRETGPGVIHALAPALQGAPAWLDAATGQPR